MSDSNEKFKWLKTFLKLLVFSLLTSTVFADNSTDYSDEDMETLLLIEPAPPVIPECGTNEVYQSCEVSCINCEQRGMCEPQNCDINHCDCRISFVHVTPEGPCEHVSVCPPRECPENEVYRHCGSFCEACDAAPCRTMDCSSRCYCKEGHRRNGTGECIPKKECPERLKCLSNDVVAESGPVSEHCLPTKSEALRGNETTEEEKCYCESGYKRNIHGWCIEESSCIYVTCFEGTEFQDCPRKCNTTCWNYGDPNCEEDGQCYPSCFCPEGYVLNEFLACIPLETCPPGSNPFAVPPLPPTANPIPAPALEETGNASMTTTAEAESGPTKATESETGTELPPTVTQAPEKSKDTEPVETPSDDKTTEAPKKPPKKAINGGKIYKSAARPGKTAYTSSDSSSKYSSAAASTEGEEKV